MKVLHTSDWHLGRSLYGRKRHGEFAAFLEWLADTINKEQIDVLIVAGDVFDTMLAPNQSQQQYFDFLKTINKSEHCNNIVIVGGNHDSPSFLDAPAGYLAGDNIHIVGAAKGDIEQEVLTLIDNNQQPLAIIAAVPYLRDRDVRTAELGEGFDEKSQKLLEGIRYHYSQVCEIAQSKQKELAKKDIDVPIIATGHLFAAGGAVTKDDGVRDLYVGTIAGIDKSIFPEFIDYVALGHLHVPQKVGGENHIRYSGSPIPMGFGEATQQKQVVVIDFEAKKTPDIREVHIPCFQKLVSIKGDMNVITNQINLLKNDAQSILVEIEYNGDEIIHDLNERINALIEGSNLEVLKIANTRLLNEILSYDGEELDIESIDVKGIFDLCLKANNTAPDDAELMRSAYQEILNDIHETDENAH